MIGNYRSGQVSRILSYNEIENQLLSQYVMGSVKFN